MGSPSKDRLCEFLDHRTGLWDLYPRALHWCAHLSGFRQPPPTPPVHQQAPSSSGARGLVSGHDGGSRRSADVCQRGSPRCRTWGDSIQQAAAGGQPCQQVGFAPGTAGPECLRHILGAFEMSLRAPLAHSRPRVPWTYVASTAGGTTFRAGKSRAHRGSWLLQVMCSDFVDCKTHECAERRCTSSMCRSGSDASTLLSCRAPGPAGGNQLGSSAVVKHAPPKGVEAPAITAPERQVKFPPSEVATPAFVPEPVEGRMNSPGLGGLTAGGTSGLQTVRSVRSDASHPPAPRIFRMLGTAKSACICTRACSHGAMRSCVCWTGHIMVTKALQSDRPRLMSAKRFMQGSFQVVAAQPISYTIQEVVGLLDVDNEVRQCHSGLGMPYE